MNSQPIAWIRVVTHSNGTVSKSLHFNTDWIEEEKEGDQAFMAPLQLLPVTPEWIEKLRHELLFDSKATHNYTFTRDEVMQLLGMAL